MEIDIEFAKSENWTADMEQRMAYLRNHDPLYWSEISQMWIATTFEDVSFISKNHEIFCSGEGVRPGNPVRFGLIDEDEPRHTRLRGLINKGFTPRMVGKLESVMKGLAKETVDAIAQKGRCDFVDDIAVPMPLLLIAEMIGIRREDRERFHEWSDGMIAGDGNFDKPEIVARAGKSFQEYTSCVREILEDRRANPKDDLASILVGADSDGVLKGELAYHGGEVVEQTGDVAIDELVMFMVLLLVAGNETTRNGISGGMQCLIENPQARRRLIEDPTLIPQAVEEMLRWATPIRSFSRTATRDVDLHGKEIKKGDVLFMVYSSANHDENEFENPEVFDIDRNPRHLAFGIGNHFCLGANLARMEMRVAFEEVLSRLPDMEYADDGPQFSPSALVRTCLHLNVKYTPEARPTRISSSG